MVLFVIFQKVFVANGTSILRINQAGTGQFERTLLIADEGICYT
jgi:Fe-S cluster assembly scaffold protein SufB